MDGGTRRRARWPRALCVALLAGWAAAAATPAGAAPAEPHVGVERPDASWRLDGVRFTVADDRFRTADDDGFTSYQAIAAQLARGARERFSLTLANQMITERGGRRRVDEGSLMGEFVRWGAASTFAVEIALHGGLSAHGNLGGARLQDGYHAIVGGTRLGGRLQDRYPERTGIAVLAGGHARARWPGQGPVAIAAVAGGSLALGGGVSQVGGSLALAYDTEHLRAEAGSAVLRFFSRDPFLTMPGGYVTGAFAAAPFLRIAVRWRDLEVEYEARRNAGGSGQGISQISVRVPLR